MQTSFTLEEANRAITLVSPIVKDIVQKMGTAKQLHEEVRHGKSDPAASETDMLGKLNQAQKLLNEVEYHMKELASVGVILKDVNVGLVDFPHTRDGKNVFLCWMPGEDRVSFWHERDEGYAKRKRVADTVWA